MSGLWHYRARVARVVDGDTIDVTLDLGFYTTTQQRLRLAGIDTPEIRGIEKAEGLKASDFVMQWVEDVEKKETEVDGPWLDWPFIVETGKTGKYGRWIAKVFAASDRANCLNYAIDKAGHSKTEGYGPGQWT